ncbi:YqhG family protein [Mesobacillus maritimus]|uniref:YqhG family protein n=1 Tax=Mesobacillus maritimus TaxID=1643336 RepID=UPI00203C4D92|nr:YqhG family protein [Mesobacillus maritimus]MCM3669612.1 YqhG family protein [Mesobacillus maritimus]
MQQQEIHDFLLRYFEANHCEFVKSEPSYMTVQLTEEMDKELMNRPFYWHYLEKTGGIPQPMQLTLVTDAPKTPEDVKGENIHFGSPRLHQIFTSTKKLAGYIRLYENKQGSPGRQTPLLPWLCLNVKISYQCDSKRDIYQSIGLQMINGRMVPDFHDQILSLSLTPKIPDYAFTLSPLIKPKSGVMRIENLLKTQINEEDHTWAEEARQRWKKDKDLLDHFYKEIDDTDSYEIEKQALKLQYEPKINISVINGGLFYLTDQAI